MGWLYNKLVKLQELGQGLQNNLAELGQEGAHHLADLEEMSSDVSADGVLFERFRSSSDIIAQIESALERIDAGEYEQCETCRKDIGEARLEALPYATQCVECKRLAENSSEAELGL